MKKNKNQFFTLSPPHPLKKKRTFFFPFDHIQKLLTTSVWTSSSLFPSQTSSWFYWRTYFILWNLPLTHPSPRLKLWIGLRKNKPKNETSLNPSSNKESEFSLCQKTLINFKSWSQHTLHHSEKLKTYNLSREICRKKERTERKRE